MRISNPFPGLRPFLENEEHLYFGREKQVDAIVDKLSVARMIAVVGTSGSGKTSLVNCGLRPALYRGLMSKAGTSWRIIQFRPGSQAIASLTAALSADGALYADYRGAIPLGEVVETSLRLSKLGLYEAIRRARLPKGTNVLIVVDQFEELFRYRSVGILQGETSGRNQEAGAFVELLLEAKRQTEVPIYIAITMRSDFLGNCSEFPGLPESINEGQYLVPQMSRDDQRSAIQGPVQVGGATISPVLLTRLVNDVGSNPDQLSILQHALNRTWATWSKEGGNGSLDLHHYESIGTMAHALDLHANETLDSLADARALKCCERVFKMLTDKGTDPRGIRRPTSFGKLCELTGAGEPELLEVLRCFRDPEQSFLMPPSSEAITSETVIDISHESLMRVWEQLIQWAAEEAQSSQQYLRLSDAARRRAANQTALWGDPDLRLALDWRARENPTAAWAELYGGDFGPSMSFLADSEEAHEELVHETELRAKVELVNAQKLAEYERLRAEQKERLAASEGERAEEQQKLASAARIHAEEQSKAARRLRFIVFAVVACLLLALIAGGFAWTLKRQADAATKEAKIQFGEAVAAKITATADEDKIRGLYDRLKTTLGLAQTAELDAQVAEIAALKQELVVASHELAVSANQANLAPELELLLALQSVLKTYDNDGSVELESADALQRAIQLSEVRQFSSGHLQSIESVAFSPDGRFVATGSLDGTTRIWDASSGLSLMTLRGSGSVFAVAYSSDGQMLATGGENKVVDLWSAVTGKKLKSFSGHTATITSIDFSRDDQHLAAASRDSSVLVWNMAHPLDSAIAFDGHSNSVQAVRFSPRGDRLATASLDGTARIWSISQPTSALAVFRPRGASEDSGKSTGINGLSFSSEDGRYLALATSDQTVTIWDTDRRDSQPERVETSIDTLRRVAYGADKNHFATVGYIRPNYSSLQRESQTGLRVAAELWDLSGGVKKTMNLYLLSSANFAYSGATTSDVAYSRDRHRLVTSDRLARIWDADKGEELVELADTSSKETVVAVSDDGRLVAALSSVNPASSDRYLRLYDGESGLEVRTLFYSPGGPSVDAVFSAGGRFLAELERDGTAHIWNTSSGEEVHVLKAVGNPSALSLRTDGEALATITGSTIKVWNCTSSVATTLTSDISGSSPLLAFSPNGLLLAGTTAERIVTLWDFNSPAKPLLGTESVSAIGFSLDSRRLAIASRNDTAKIWDTRSASPAALPVLQVPGVESLVFDQPGSSLATLSRDGTLRVWNTHTAAEELSVTGVSGLPSRVVFKANGDLLSVSRDMTLRNYPREIDDAMAIALGLVTRSLTSDECLRYLHTKVCPNNNLAFEELARGNNFLVAGDESSATASFGKVRALEPALRLNVEKHLRNFRMTSLLSNGREQAWRGDWKGATNTFASAFLLNHDLNFNPRYAAEHLASSSIFAYARNLARSGDVAGATAKFKIATDLSPGATLDALAEANRWSAQSFASEGVTLAESGDVTGAAADFDQARKLDPRGDSQRRTMESSLLRSLGDARAAAEDLSGAIAIYQAMSRIDPSRSLRPEEEANSQMSQALVARGLKARLDQHYLDATKAYLKAADVYIKFPLSNPRIGDDLNDLCWEGSVRGHAAEVIEACNRAVPIAGRRLADFRDSRGLARALTGDRNGAIEDFQFFAANTNYDDRRKQRQGWIDTLLAGGNPFSPDVLKLIANQ